MIESTHFSSLTLPTLTFVILLLVMLVNESQAYIAWIGFILEWMVQPLKCRMRIFAFKSKWATIFLILQVTFAIIWPISIGIGWSSEVLRLMSVDALSPIMFHILLRTVDSLIPINVEHFRVHGALEFFQILRKVLLIIGHIKRHCISYSLSNTYWLCSSFENLFARKEEGTGVSLSH